MRPADLFPVNTLIYWIGRMFITCLQSLPLRGAARLGQALGWLAFHLDRKHRNIALENMSHSLPGTTGQTRLDLARTHFLRLGENYVSAIKTSAMKPDEIRQILRVTGTENLANDPATGRVRNQVIAVGHFGNFELYSRTGLMIPGSTIGTTYRGIKPAGLDRLLRELRETSGCRLFERREGGAGLKQFLSQPGSILGLLVDQHGGDNGIRLPFLGRDASTNPSPAVFALRYDCPLSTAICYREGLGRWHVEFGPVIPTRHPDGSARSIADITADVNQALEKGVLKDPPNWFWVHRRWKPAKKKKSPTPVSGGSESVRPPTAPPP